MTNRVIYPPFLQEPPIYDALLENGQITDPWRNWFDNITRITGFAITHDRYAPNAIGVPAGDDVALTSLVQLTQPQRDALQNARDATVIYNLTTSRVNFREGGTWVTFLPILA